MYGFQHCTFTEESKYLKSGISKYLLKIFMILRYLRVFRLATI